jgi:hypothetical protein
VEEGWREDGEEAEAEGAMGCRVGVTHATYECTVLWGCSSLAPSTLTNGTLESCVFFVVWDIEILSFL